MQAPTRRLVVDGRSVTVVRGPIVSGEGGVSVHGALSGRDAADSHPLAAVTGLGDALAGKAAGGEVVAAFMTHPGTLPAGAPWAGQTVLVAGVGTDAGLHTIDAGGALTQIAGAPDLAPGQWAVEVVDPLGDPRGPAVFVAFDLTAFGGLAGVSEITIDPTFGPLGAALAAKADAVHEHVAADVTDLDAVVGAAVGAAVADGLSNATPADLGTAAPGVSTEASRADHVHDMPTAAQVGALPDNTALLALGETSTTAYRGDRGKTAYDHSQITTGNPHGTTAADVGAEPAGVVSDVPQSTFIGAPIAPFTTLGTATAATAPGTLILSPVAHSWTGVARFWWDITATSATSGQTLHLVVYSPGTGGRPGSLLWSQAFDAATVQQATTTTPASVIPNRGWWGVLFPSTLAGNVTMRFGYPAATTASNFLGAFGNFACSFAATSQGSTPESSISSYTFGTTPAATVLGASHALRPVCPLIFLRGS